MAVRSCLDHRSVESPRHRLKDLLRWAFPQVVSYNRFVELMSEALVPLCAYLRTRKGTCSGISFIDSMPIAVCHNRRIHSHQVFDETLRVGGRTSSTQQVAFLMLDEFSYYRQPKLAQAFWPMGRRYQPPAIRHCGSNTRGRIVGALNGITGKLSYHMASSITVLVFSDFLTKLASEYSHYQKIYIVLDNWPTVHRHPKVLALMKKLGITPLFLPIYSPESNPIEILWHALTDEVLNLHRDSSCWTTLKERVNNWLSVFTKPSQSILKRVGLFSRRAIGCNADEHWAVGYH